MRRIRSPVPDVFNITKPAKLQFIIFQGKPGRIMDENKTTREGTSELANVQTGGFSRCSSSSGKNDAGDGDVDVAVSITTNHLKMLI